VQSIAAQKEFEMMKAGIVSLYTGYNFGNKLQNYAVETLLKNEGLAPETLKYEIGAVPVRTRTANKLSPKYLRGALRIRLGRVIPMKNSCAPLSRRLRYLLPANRKAVQRAKAERAEAYRAFDQKYLHFSDRTIRLDESCEAWTEQYVFFFCGSDQVWNPYYASTTGVCFLQFAPPEKRIALAPSFGVGSIPESRRDSFRTWISEIPSLSVREETGREIIRELTGREATVLLDPTMLLDTEEWDAFCEEPRFKLPERYVLSYFLGDRTREYDLRQKELARDLNCEIVNLFDLMQPAYYACSPNAFVYCIRHAEAVCTDSFHATVFSILYRRRFIAFERVEGERVMSSRFYTLLEKFGLTDRLYRDGPLPAALPDYSGAGDVLSRERELAKNYLRAALEKGRNE
jgi:hypothetical protein